MAAKKDFVIEQRATFYRRMVWRDKFKKPIDLTGAKARMQIRASDGSLICDLSTENGKIVITPLSGVIELKIPASETSTMNFTVAQYDLKIYLNDVDQTEKRLLQGKVTISQGQTQ